MLGPDGDVLVAVIWAARLGVSYKPADGSVNLSWTAVSLRCGAPADRSPRRQPWVRDGRV